MTRALYATHEQYPDIVPPNEVWFNTGLTHQQLYDLTDHPNAVVRYGACQKFAQRYAEVALLNSGYSLSAAQQHAKALAARVLRTVSKKDLEKLTPEMIRYAVERPPESPTQPDDRVERYQELGKALVRATEDRRPIQVYASLPSQPAPQRPVVNFDLNPLAAALQAQADAFRELASALREPRKRTAVLSNGRRVEVLEESAA